MDLRKHDVSAREKYGGPTIDFHVDRFGYPKDINSGEEGMKKLE